MIARYWKLSSVRINDDKMLHLHLPSNLANLHVLNLSSCGHLKDVYALGGLTNLHTLNLHRCYQ